jgi:hypothetical protein
MIRRLPNENLTQSNPIDSFADSISVSAGNGRAAFIVRFRIAPGFFGSAQPMVYCAMTAIPLKRFATIPRVMTRWRVNTVYAIMEDRQGWIWVGTMGGGLNKFDPETETFTRYQHDPNNPNTPSGDGVIALLEDDQGMIWVGVEGKGLNKFNAHV